MSGTRGSDGASHKHLTSVDTLKKSKKPKTGRCDKRRDVEDRTTLGLFERQKQTSVCVFSIVSMGYRQQLSQTSSVSVHRSGVVSSKEFFIERPVIK